MAAFTSGDETMRPTSHRTDEIHDRRGDATAHVQGSREARSAERLADVLAVRYRTPEHDGGRLRIKTRWAHLRDGTTEPERTRQYQVIQFYGRTERDMWTITINSATKSVELVDSAGDRVRAEYASVIHQSGPSGTMRLTVSSEWLDLDHVVLDTFAYVGKYRAVDELRYSRRLVVGD